METPEEKHSRRAQTSQNDVPSQFAHIKGWGIDADPSNNPTHPMKQRVDIEHTGYNWERPVQQAVDTEVLHSIERPNVSAVFGTSSPPSGLSGIIRRWAFQYSEDQYNHWLGLVLADRINMMEGVLDDFAHGHIPNLVEEKGLRADWDYDREKLLGKIALGVGIAGLAWWLWQRRSETESVIYDEEDNYFLDDEDDAAAEYFGNYDREAFYGTIRPL